MPHFLDTNILLYSISRRPEEAAKRDIAIDLLDDDDGAVSIQVFHEFYVQATRPSRADPLPHALAVGLIHSWKRFRVQDMNFAVLESALRITAAHRLPFWDSAVISAAAALGCQKLYTEDLHHGQTIEGVTIANPFAEPRHSPTK